MDVKKLRGYIHTADEATLLVHAIRLGLVIPISERLSNDERDTIRTGSIFCFVENDSGMKRWTDGKIWSPSKILGQFLLYKEVPRHLSKSALKKEKNSERRRRSYTYGLGRDFYCDDDFTMYKKTISLTVDGKNYHVISYFQPFFDKKNLIQLPFFRELKICLENNQELEKDDFVEKNYETLAEKFKLPSIIAENFRADLDRATLEMQAIHVLGQKFKMERR